MKTPEKIYVHKSQYWGLMANECNITKYDIEYIRTDAFIERALKWMTNQGGVNDVLSVEMIEDFKKYMKGE